MADESYPTKTLTVSFSEDDTQTDESFEISIELDDELNEEKSEFAFGEDCYFRIFSSHSDYAIKSSHSSCKVKKRNSTGTEKTEITMPDIDNGTVSHDIVRIVDIDFSGKGRSTSYITEAEKLINSGGNLVGFLDVEYSFKYDSWKLQGIAKPVGYDDEEDPGFQVLIVARNRSASATLIVTFKNEIGEDTAQEDTSDLGIELDDTKNLDEEDKPKSVFEFGEKCYFRVYSEVDYTTDSSAGSTSDTGAEVGVIENEKIAIADLSEFSVSKKIKDIVGSEFSGKGSLGNLTIGEDRKTLTNSGGELLGFLTISYSIDYFGGILSGVSKPIGYDDEEDPGFEVIILAETEDNKANTTATFKVNPEGVDDGTGDESSDTQLSIFLDPETVTNKSDPEDPESGLKSEFKFGEISVFRVVAEDLDKDYSVHHSIEYGQLIVEGVELKKIDSKDEFTHEEEISFDLDTEGNLAYEPVNIISYEWIDETTGSDPEFDGKAVTLPEETIGTLKVKYTAIGDLWELLVTEFVDAETYLLDIEAKLPVTLVARQGESKASASVTYVHPEAEDEDEDSESSLSISIELDETKNLEDEPNEDGEYDSKSDFMFEEECFFRVFSDKSSFTVESSHGEASILAPETAIIEDEKLSFAGTDKASTSKKIKSIISTSFDGRGEIGSFKVGEDGKELTNSRGDLVGFLTVSYTTECYSGVLTGVLQPNPYDLEKNEGQEVIILADITNDDAAASTSATFKGEEVEEESGELSISIHDVIVDSTPVIEDNFVYNADDDEWSLKSAFEFGTKAVLRVIKDSEDTEYEVQYSLDVLPNWHYIKKITTNVNYREKQTITFSQSDSGSLSYTPVNVISHRWLHDAPHPTPEFEDKEIKLESSVVGFLEVEYEVSCDEWELFVDEIVGDEYATLNDEGLRELKVAVVAYNADNSASTEVSFADEEQSEADIEISAALDDLSNEQLYGEAKSTFKYGEKAYIKVFGPRPISGFANWNSATLRLDSPYFVYEYEDRLTVVNTDEASLTMKPVGNVDWEWEGSATQGIPTFDEKEITFSQKVKCGILKATYFTMGQRWYVTIPQDPDPDNPTDEEGVEDTSTEVLCVFIPDNYTDDSASLSVTFEGEQGEETWEVRIIDHCSGEPVQGAYITGIDGLIGGKTSEANGRVFKGKLPFRTYNVGNITKDGYLPSHSDPISNESFEIKPEEEE